MTRVDDDRQMRELLDGRDGAEVERIARERLVRADAALAEDDLLVAARHDVLRRIEPFADGRREAALEHDRLLGLAERLEELEVLHVARADLVDVGVLADDLDVVLVDDFRDDLEAFFIGYLAQHLEALFSQALEVVRARARLERAAAQEFRAARLDRLGGLAQLLNALDRARACHDDDFLTADLDAVDIDNRVLRMEVATDELVFLRDAHGLLDALEHADLEVGDLLAVADDADDRAVLARRQMGLEADLLQALFYFLDILFRSIWFHDNDHNGFLLTIPRFSP